MNDEALVTETGQERFDADDVPAADPVAHHRP